jgi:hypothetical protein
MNALEKVSCPCTKTNNFPQTPLTFLFCVASLNIKWVIQNFPCYLKPTYQYMQKKSINVNGNYGLI